jgi:hypothetical protein
VASRKSRAPIDPRDFVRERGIVLESAGGFGNSLAEAVAGEPISGNWWGHERRGEIFRATRHVRDWDEVLVCRLLSGKVTYVHRRLWPALVRLQAFLGAAALGALREEHTNTGAHQSSVTPFPGWVPPDVHKAGLALSETEAWRLLGTWLKPQVREK